MKTCTSAVRTACAIATALLMDQTWCTGAVLHVSPSGNDTASGQTWAAAKRTVNGALLAAQARDEIWVAAGIYTERIHLKNEVALYGGFNGAEQALAQRDFGRNLTILDGGGAGIVVRCELAGATGATRLDGFVVRNGSGIMGGGIACTATSPTIANNLITQNVSAGPGGGICCYNGANPLIIGNRIIDNRAGGDDADGGGIACMTGSKGNLGSSPTIIGNLIARNRAEENGGGIAAKGTFVSEDGQVVIPSAPTILNNLIAQNLSTEAPLGDRSLGGGGIACVDDGMAKIIANNTIVANSGWHAGGILLVGGARDNPSVINNTLVGNNGPALRWVGVNTIRIANNILAYNTAGLSRPAGLPPGQAVIRHNLVHGNVIDFDGLPNLVGQEGNLGFEPRLASWTYGDHHLQPDSPCVNAGDDTWVQAEWQDADGTARRQGGRTDIGADECDGQTRNVNPRVIRVRPNGDDQRDGSSWANAKRTVRAAIAAIHDHALDHPPALLGGEVWVSAGTYTENLALPPHVYLYGGFIGSETDRAQRNWQLNPTILDGAAKDRVVLAVGGHDLSSVDGFQVRNGRVASLTSGQGGGIECYHSGARLAHNVITANNAFLGAGVGSFCASPSLSDCIITNNYAGGDGKGQGAGVHLDRSLGHILNCVIAGNLASEGGGIYGSFSQPQIIGNQIFGNNGKGISLWNSSGISWLASTRLRVAGNQIYQNTTSHEGAGIYTLLCSGEIINNIVALNRSGTLDGGGTGGGMALTGGAEGEPPLLVAHNSILGNTTEYFGLNFGGGIHTYLLKLPTIIIANNIVAYNSSGLCNYRGSPVSPILIKNNVFSNNGLDHQMAGLYGLSCGPLNYPTDVSWDPQFVSLNGDFQLRAGSPCIDAAGEIAAVVENDLASQPRPLDGNNDGRAQADIGAYEYVHEGVGGQIQFESPAMSAHASASPCRVALRRIVGVGGAASVDYTSRDGSARAGIDYRTTNGRAAFAAGQAVAEIQVPLLNNPNPSGPKTLTLALHNPQGATLGAPAEITITLFPTPPSAASNPWNIPESWIAQYNLRITETSDADGDGLLDWREYAAGCDPTNPRSVLKFTSAARTPDRRGVALTWASVPGKRYNIKQATRITGGVTWETMAGGIAAAGTTTTWIAPAQPQTTSFFRVEVQP